MRFIGNVEKDAQVRAVASGALSSGDTVIVNSDGTVSVIEETDVSQSVGTPVQFSSSKDDWVASTYDANSQKVVIAFADNDGGGKGTAVVGTVSGTSISFGTPVVFETGNTQWISCTYDANAQKVVIAFTDASNSGRGKGVVGTVSGTSISFGSITNFSNNSCSYVSCAYDANAQKVVIAYRDEGLGFDGYAIVGTVSGTSISFGSAVEFETGNTAYTSVVYDASAQKIVIAYTDDSDGDAGKARVGTVSGTSISFGGITQFEAGTTYDISSAYDASAQKVVIAYSDFSNSRYGTAVVGTVSGTSISFGTPVVFESANTRLVTTAYDINAQKVLISYRDDGNSSYPTSIVGTVSDTSISFGSPVVLQSETVDNYMTNVYDEASKTVVVAWTDQTSVNSEAAVFQNAYTSTNLTSENFLGFAAHTYADTQSAVINSTCTVDRNQTSLTAGQKYYVQTDGALGTTPGDPSVEAGTAISSTEIIVKG